MRRPEPAPVFSPDTDWTPLCVEAAVGGLCALAEAPQWRAPGLASVLNIVFLGLFCSALGYWLYIATLEILGPGRASLYLNLIPVVSVVAAYFLLGERLGLAQLAGGGAAIVGVYLATLPEG